MVPLSHRAADSTLWSILRMCCCGIQQLCCEVSFCSCRCLLMFCMWCQFVFSCLSSVPLKVSMKWKFPSSFVPYREIFLSKTVGWGMILSIGNWLNHQIDVVCWLLRWFHVSDRLLEGLLFCLISLWLLNIKALCRFVANVSVIQKLCDLFGIRPSNFLETHI